MKSGYVLAKRKVPAAAAARRRTRQIRRLLRFISDVERCGFFDDHLYPMAPYFAALARASRSGALGNLQAATAELDRVVGAGRLEAWEDAAWESVEVDGGVAGSGDTALPFGLGPNAFTCAVFSCYNSPDTPVSTSLLLDVKMLQKGVELGARGDSRVSATGLLGNVGDLVEKLDAYAAALAAARAPAPPE